jgi:hypothetical protein
MQSEHLKFFACIQEIHFKINFEKTLFDRFFDPVEMLVPFN